MKPDIRGFMFLPNDSGEIVERVYSEKQHKYKLKAVYGYVSHGGGEKRKALHDAFNSVGEIPHL